MLLGHCFGHIMGVDTLDRLPNLLHSQRCLVGHGALLGESHDACHEQGLRLESCWPAAVESRCKKALPKHLALQG